MAAHDLSGFGITRLEDDSYVDSSGSDSESSSDSSSGSSGDEDEQRDNITGLSGDVSLQLGRTTAHNVGTNLVLSGPLSPNAAAVDQPHCGSIKVRQLSVEVAKAPIGDMMVGLRPTETTSLGGHANRIVGSYVGSDSDDDFDDSLSPLGSPTGRGKANQSVPADSPQMSRPTPFNFQMQKPNLDRRVSLHANFGRFPGGNPPRTPPPQRHRRASTMSYGRGPNEPFTPPPLGRMVRRPTLDSQGSLYTGPRGVKRIMSANDSYILVKSLGRGAFGKVKLVKSARTDKQYAMKIMDVRQLMRQRKCGIILRKSPSLQNTTGMEQVQREIAIMKKVAHPNVVQCYEVIHDEKRDKLFLVMDYCERGPVHKGVPESWTPLEEDLAWRFFRDMIQGLEYLHMQEHVIHRDIKPENLLITGDERLKICDFGESEEFVADDHVDKFAGTPEFMAPELCRGAKGFSGQEADIWSAGVCLYTFIYAKLPFTAPTRMAIYDVIADEKEIDLPEDSDIEVRGSLADLMKGMICKDISKRLTMEQVRAHPWVTQDGKWPLPELKDMNKIVINPEDITSSWSTIVRVHRTFKKKLEQIRKRLQLRKNDRGKYVMRNIFDQQLFIHARADQNVNPRGSRTVQHAVSASVAALPSTRRVTRPSTSSGPLPREETSDSLGSVATSASEFSVMALDDGAS